MLLYLSLFVVLLLFVALLFSSRKAKDTRTLVLIAGHNAAGKTSLISYLKNNRLPEVGTVSSIETNSTVITLT